MAAALVVTDEAEGEGGDEGDDEDVRERDHCAEEPPRCKAHKRNQSEDELNPDKGEREGNIGQKLVPEASGFECGCKQKMIEMLPNLLAIPKRITVRRSTLLPGPSLRFIFSGPLRRKR